MGQLVRLLEHLADRRGDLGLAVVDEATRELPVVLVALQVEAVGPEHHDHDLALDDGVAGDERTASVVLVEQPLVPGGTRDDADLELAEAGVHHDVVTLVVVGPARDGARQVVVEHG